MRLFFFSWSYFYHKLYLNELSPTQRMDFPLLYYTKSIQSGDLALIYIIFRWRSNLMTRKPTVNSLGNACEVRVGNRNRNKDIFGILEHSHWEALLYSHGPKLPPSFVNPFFIFLLWILFTSSVFTFFPIPSRELLYTTKHVWKEDYQAYMLVRKKIRHMNFIFYMEYLITPTFLCNYFMSRHKMEGRLWKFSASLLTGENVVLSPFILSYIFLCYQVNLRFNSESGISSSNVTLSLHLI